jgi:UPF0176 protein
VTAPITVSAFYKFVAIDDCRALRDELLAIAVQHEIKGTILVAEEGINATVSGADAGAAALLAYLRNDPRFATLVSKESYASEHPFKRLKVKIKPEIVTIGAPEANPARHVGTYVAPADWNALISDPEVIVIDTRNAYEVDIGTFQGAIDPRTSSFGEFPDYVKQNLDPARDRKVAMFCTGGIRCEKASAYLLSLGFPKVYHLEGGILKYLETVPASESLWKGECFVFDERVALEHGVKVGSHSLCPDCGYPVAKAEAASGETPRCPHCA